MTQRVFVISEAVAAMNALQWNQYLGIPNVAVYMFTMCFAQNVDGSFAAMTRYMIFSKLVPYGVEATMMGTIDAIVKFTTRTIREIMGNGINDAFIHVSNNNKENYY